MSVFKERGLRGAIRKNVITQTIPGKNLWDKVNNSRKIGEN